jgi:hypothetical protein
VGGQRHAPTAFPWERDPVPIVGGPIGPVWTCSENLGPSKIRSPDSPARRQSLYRLRYPGNPFVKFPSQHLRHVDLQQAMFGLSCFNRLRAVLCASRLLKQLPSSAKAYMSYCAWHCAIPRGRLPARDERTLRNVAEGLYSSIE